MVERTGWVPRRLHDTTIFARHAAGTKGWTASVVGRWVVILACFCAIESYCAIEPNCAIEPFGGIFGLLCNRACGGEIAAEWNFGRRDDQNYDFQADGWEREVSRVFPHYLKLYLAPREPQFAAKAVRLDAQLLASWRALRNRWPQLPSVPPNIADLLVDRYLRGELEGGAIRAASAPLAVSQEFSYRLEAEMMTEQLVHHQAWVALSFYDNSGNTVASYSGPKLGGTSPWQPIAMGPFAAPRQAAYARVHLHFEAGELRDLKGAFGIDRIVIKQMPRIRLESNIASGLYPVDAQPEISCIVSGMLDENAMIQFEVQDELGTPLHRQQLPLARTLEKKGEGGVSGESGDASEGQAAWQLPKLSPGFYRVLATLSDTRGGDHDVEHSLGILESLPQPQGPFGWSLTGADHRMISIRQIPEWLSQCRVQWAKYPCWLAPDNTVELEEIARLMGRLEDRGIQTVAVLGRPPSSVAKVMGVREDDPAAVLFRDTATWQPLLEPVMARLSSGVRWWQLGDEGDTSFLGRAQLRQTIDEIRVKLQGYGQPIQLVLNWPWGDAIPPADQWSWHAVCVADPIAPTLGEMQAYFSDRAAAELQFIAPPNGTNGEVAAKLVTKSLELAHTGTPISDAISAASGAKANPAGMVSESAAPQGEPWIVIDPLPRGVYSREERIRDLILKMLAVRQLQVPAAFISDPFKPELGVLKPDGTPDELLLPWRTSAALLGGMQPLGSLELPSGSENMLLVDETSACLVVWNEQPCSENFYFGADARQIDCYGRSMPIRSVTVRECVQQQIQVLPVPTFVTNIDRIAALWALGVRLNRQRIDSFLGRNQEVRVEYNNNSSQTISGTLRVLAPETWGISPIPRSFNVEINGLRSEPISMALRNDATIGRSPIYLRFSLDGQTERQFEVIRYLEVGPADVRIEVVTRLLPDGRLHVHQEITNESDAMQQFDCYVYAPQRLRERESIRVPPHSTVERTVHFANGEQLIGKVLQLRADQTNGSRTLNVRFKATR